MKLMKQRRQSDGSVSSGCFFLTFSLFWYMLDLLNYTIILIYLYKMEVRMWEPI